MTWNRQQIPRKLYDSHRGRDDNRLENVRILCPNHHARTPTYRGRNIANARWAPVSQLAEERVLNTLQCGFESHPGHHVRAGQRRVGAQRCHLLVTERSRAVDERRGGGL